MEIFEFHVNIYVICNLTKINRLLLLPVFLIGIGVKATYKLIKFFLASKSLFLFAK